MTGQAIIFDLDDTLYEERTYAFSGFAAVAATFAKRLGDPHETGTLMRQLFDTEHRARVFDEVLKRRSLAADPNLIAEMVATFRAHRPNIRLFDDAERALTYWRDRARTGIISDGPAVMQRAKVEALRLGERVDEIILTDECGPDSAKPSAKAFALMASRLSVSHDSCVYIADNPAKDFVGPNALGWKTIQVIRADGVYQDREAPPGGAPKWLVHRLDELPAILV